MKLPKTFIPEKGLENKIEELEHSNPFKPTSLAIALAYAYKGGWATDILIWTPNTENLVKIATRNDYIKALCVHNNLLYEAGYSNEIIDTLHNKTIAKRSHSITSLCSHNGVMYDGGLKRIYNTNSRKVVAARPGWVKSLCNSNGELYDTGSYKQIIKTFTDEVVAERKEWVYALGSHNNTLYDATTDNKIRDTFNNKVIAKRKGIPFTLFTFNGELYDAGQYYPVYETLRFFKKKFLEIKQTENYKFEFYRGITAVQPISSWLARKLLFKSNP